MDCGVLVVHGGRVDQTRSPRAVQMIFLHDPMVQIIANHDQMAEVDSEFDQVIDALMCAVGQLWCELVVIGWP